MPMLSSTTTADIVGMSLGMNLGTAPDRLLGAASFPDSSLIAYPKILTVGSSS